MGAEVARLRVFLSYSRKDGEFVARLAEALTGPKFEAAYDASPHAKNNPELGIAAEDEWWKQLERMIAAADAMVFIVSPDSIASKVCDEEIVYARTMGKRVIAVMRREIDFAKAPPRLAALNVKLRFLDDSEAGFAASLAALSEALELDAAWWREQTWLAEQVKTWRDAAEDKRTDWLLSAAELERAERWAARRPVKAPPMSEAELDFLAASRARQAELAEEETRKLKVRRRLQLGVLVLTVVALVISIGGGIFVVDRQRSVARSESLMLANAARGQADAGADASALRLSLIAARDTFLSPASVEAEALLARTSAAWRVEKEFLAKPGTTQKAVISDDGKRIVTWNADGENGDLLLWDTGSGRVVATLKPSDPTAIAPSASNVWFAGDLVVAQLEDLVFQGDAQVVVWRAATGEWAWERTAPVLFQNPLLSRNGGLLVLPEQQLTSEDGVEGAAVVRVVALATGRIVFERAGQPQSLDISDDGTRLAWWDNDRIEVLTIADGKTVSSIKAAFGLLEARDAIAAGISLDDDAAKAMRFSPDGSRVIAWVSGHGLQGWTLDTPTGTRFLNQRIEGTPDGATGQASPALDVSQVAFSQDGKRVVMWDNRGDVRLMRLDSGETVDISTVGADRSTTEITPLPDMSGVIALSQSDSVLRVWSFDDAFSPRLQLPHGSPLFSVTMSADGKRALTMDRSPGWHVVGYRDRTEACPAQS